MANDWGSKLIKDDFNQSRLLRLGGCVLWLLGLITLCVSFGSSVFMEGLQKLLIPILFFAIGFALWLHTSVLQKIAALEKQVRELQQK